MGTSRASGVRGRVSLLLVGAAIVVVGAAALLWTRATQPGRPHNLILISLDTLRADRLDLYGYDRETAPNLTRFAQRGVVFGDVVTAAPWTLPSHVTMFTGMYPTSHGVTNSRHKIAPHTRVIAELLQQRGYRNFAYTGGGNMARRFGFDRGFELYKPDPGVSRYDVENFSYTVAKAKSTIQSLKDDEPYFLFLHTFDIHCPYAPPEPYYSMFNSPGAKETRTDACGGGIYTQEGFTKDHARYVSDRYDGGIRWVDDALGELFSFLEAEGQLENTVVVITSDHGEEFLEHGRIGHTESLFRELLMVPLVIVAPGFAQGTVPIPVSLVDLYPTLLELLGVPVPSETQGMSLVPFMRGELPAEPPRAFQFSELDRGVKLRSALSPFSHLITDPEGAPLFFFDVASDPLEQRNLVDQAGEALARRAREFSTFLTWLKRGQGEDVAEPSNEELETLRTLGYL